MDTKIVTFTEFGKLTMPQIFHLLRSIRGKKTDNVVPQTEAELQAMIDKYHAEG